MLSQCRLAETLKLYPDLLKGEKFPGMLFMESPLHKNMSYH